MPKVAFSPGDLVECGGSSYLVLRVLGGGWLKAHAGPLDAPLSLHTLDPKQCEVLFPSYLAGEALAAFVGKGKEAGRA